MFVLLLMNWQKQISLSHPCRYTNLHLMMYFCLLLARIEKKKDHMNNLTFVKQSRFTSGLRDSLVMIKRSSRHIIRNTDQLLGTFFQPILFLVLFQAVFAVQFETAFP